MPTPKDYELDYYARNTVAELRRQLAAQSRYIAELEKQLEPSVVAEIREELSEEQDLEGHQGAYLCDKCKANEDTKNANL